MMMDPMTYNQLIPPRRDKLARIPSTQARKRIRAMPAVRPLQPQCHNTLPAGVILLRHRSVHQRLLRSRSGRGSVACAHEWVFTPWCWGCWDRGIWLRCLGRFLGLEGLRSKLGIVVEGHDGGFVWSLWLLVRVLLVLCWYLLGVTQLLLWHLNRILLLLLLLRHAQSLAEEGVVLLLWRG